MYIRCAIGDRVLGLRRLVVSAMADAPSRTGRSMSKTSNRISASFHPDEVLAVYKLLQTIRRGGDATVMARAEPVRLAEAIFARMAAKAKMVGERRLRRKPLTRAEIATASGLRNILSVREIAAYYACEHTTLRTARGRWERRARALLADAAE